MKSDREHAAADVLASKFERQKSTGAGVLESEFERERHR